MFVQVGRTGERRQGKPLGAVRRKQEDLGVAALDIGAEHGRDAPAAHLFAEYEVSLGEIDTGVFAAELKIANVIALPRIEAGVEYLMCQFPGRYSGAHRQRRENESQQYRKSGHQYSLRRPQVPGFRTSTP
jgi:hypothetical protein